MKVSYYPANRSSRGRIIETLLSKHHVKHELIGPDDRRRSRIAMKNDVPAVEVDGRIFVNPNETALKKILKIA